MQIQDVKMEDAAGGGDGGRTFYVKLRLRNAESDCIVETCPSITIQDHTRSTPR